MIIERLLGAADYTPIMTGVGTDPGNILPHIPNLRMDAADVVTDTCDLLSGDDLRSLDPVNCISER